MEAARFWTELNGEMRKSMKDNKLFKGIYSALFSVYDEDMKVKKDTVQKLVDYQLAGGVQGFYVGGNTGECLVLPTRVRKNMLEAVIGANRGRGKIIVHVGAGHIEDVYELIDHANALPVDAISSLPPSLQGYYNTEEMVEYYRIVAERSRVPVFSYITNIFNIDSVRFAEQLMQIPNVIGLKVTRPDYYQFGKIAKVNGGNINILNGPDETMICGLSVGADGAIGTSYNILPKVAVGIYENFMSGNIFEAMKCQNQLNSVIDIVFGKNLAYWKAIMSIMGYDMGYTVEPQKIPDKQECAAMARRLKEIGLDGLIG